MTMAGGYRAAYGLDCSSGQMVLARGTRRGSPTLQLVAAAESEEASRALRAVAREVMRGQALLAVAAPATRTVVRRLRAPFASVKKAARVWPSLLDIELPFPVEGAVCFFGSPRVEQGKTEAVAAALRKSDLHEYAEDLRSAGIEATHCDAAALALWDQLGAEVPAARADGSRALVWLGGDHALVVRGRGQTFLAAHVFRASSDAGGAFESLWASRMKMILSAHQAETGAAGLDLWWAGPGAEDESRMVRLRQVLPTEPAIRHETLRQPATVLARALARRAAEGTGVNFKTGEWAHPAWVRAEAYRRRTACLGAAVLAMLVLALNIVEFRLRRAQNEELQRKLTAAAEALVGGSVPRGLESLMAERALPARDTETQAIRTAMDSEGLESRWVRILSEFAALNIEISRMSMSPSAVSVEGTAPSIQAIEGLAEQFRAQGWTVQSDSPGGTAEGRTRFVLKGTGGA